MRFLKKIGLLWLLLILGVYSVGIVSAREVRQGDQCVVEPDHTVDGNLFVLCRTLLIEGTVTGDVIGAATSVNLAGTIKGDVYLIAGRAEVRGEVGRGLHFAGVLLNIFSPTKFTDERGDILALSLSTRVDRGVLIPGTITAAGYQLEVNGHVESDVNYWGSSLLIGGRLDKDVYAEVGDSQADISQVQGILEALPLDFVLNAPGLRVQPGGRIDGRMTYTAPTEALVADGALVREVAFTPVQLQPDFTQIVLEDQDESRGLGIYLAQVLREFIVLGSIGALGLFLFPRALLAPGQQLQSRPLPCLGIGLLTFVTSLVSVLAAIAITILLIVLISTLQISEFTLVSTLLLTVFDMGIASSVLFVVIFLSRVVLCLAIGRLIVQLIAGENTTRQANFLGLIIGVILLAVISPLPVIGLGLQALVVFLGLGAIILVLQSRPAPEVREPARAGARYVNVQPARPPLPAAPTLTRSQLQEPPRLVMPPPPPPAIEPETQMPGGDNLPEGFNWWGETDDPDSL